MRPNGKSQMESPLSVMNTKNTEVAIARGIFHWRSRSTAVAFPLLSERDVSNVEDTFLLSVRLVRFVRFVGLRWSGGDVRLSDGRRPSFERREETRALWAVLRRGCGVKLESIAARLSGRPNPEFMRKIRKVKRAVLPRLRP